MFIGLIFSYPIFLVPLSKIIRASSWEPVPGMIVSSALTDRVTIQFRYQVGAGQFAGSVGARASPSRQQ